MKQVNLTFTFVWLCLHPLTGYRDTDIIGDG